MPTTCPKCGVVLNPSGKTHINKTCATCLQTEEIRKTNQRREIQERCQRERDAKSTPSYSGGGGGGGGGCVGFFILAALLIGGGIWGWGKFQEWRKDPDVAKSERIGSIEKATQEMQEKVKKLRSEMGGPFAEESELKDAEKRLLELQNQKKQVEETASNQKFVKPRAQSSSERVLNSFEGVSLPVSIVVTEGIKLLDATGKEVDIPIGSIIRVKERKPSGTLTTEMKGAIYVGNESRILGKVRHR